MDRPSIRELECFVAVAEELHFSKAAKRLHMSQPPLSRQIQSLERKLGVQLLKRKTRLVELTSPGRSFLNDARETLHSLDRAMITVQRMQQGENERLRLGFIGYLLAPDLVEVLRGFRKARDLSQFGDDGHRGDLRNASQGLQGFDHRAHLGWRRARCFQNRLIQPFGAGHQVLDLVDVVAERDLLGGLLEMNLRLDPLQMSVGPRRLDALRTLRFVHDD